MKSYRFIELSGTLNSQVFLSLVLSPNLIRNMKFIDFCWSNFYILWENSLNTGCLQMDNLEERKSENEILRFG